MQERAESLAVQAGRKPIWLLPNPTLWVPGSALHVRGRAIHGRSRSFRCLLRDPDIFPIPSQIGAFWFRVYSALCPCRRCLLGIFTPFKLVHVQRILQESESQKTRIRNGHLSQCLGELVKSTQTPTAPKCQDWAVEPQKVYLRNMSSLTEMEHMSTQISCAMPPPIF